MSDDDTDGVRDEQAQDPASSSVDRDHARLAVMSEWAHSHRHSALVLRRFVPDHWASHAAVGLDGVLRITPPRPAAPVDARPDEGPDGSTEREPWGRSHGGDEAEAEVEVEVEVEDLLADLRCVLLGSATLELDPDRCLEAVRAGHRLTGILHASTLRATGQLAARTGERLLREAGATDPGELSRTARERWRARVKTLTALEIEALTGLGRYAARELVALATAPTPVRAAIAEGLMSGTTRGDQVSAWWRRCSQLPHEDASDIARRLFADIDDPQDVVPERRTPDGDVTDRPWAAAEFRNALEREATRAEGKDPGARANARAARARARDGYGVIDDDGTGKVVLTGDAASVSACVDRLHLLARRARQAGDPRTQSQLRSDVGRALLLHGTLPLPDLGDEPSLITPDDIERLVQVLAGTPGYEVQVVVPWDVVAGTPALSTVNLPPATWASGRPEPTSTAPDTQAASESGPRTSPEGRGTRTSPDAAHASPNVAHDEGAGVGEQLGRFRRYLTPDEIRHILCRTGTTLYRLLTDPADGRCIERTLARYQPDAAMRSQVRAADLTSRGPGSTVLVRDADLDHVTAYLLGGPTSEPNLQGLDRVWHAAKTQKHWRAEIDATRTVTWTSLWGRLYRTRGHDYSQYLRLAPAHPRSADPGAPDPRAAATSPDSGAPPGGRPPSTGLSTDEQRHLASLLVYAALAHHDPGSRLESDTDDPDNDGDLPDLRRLRKAIQLRHTRPDGTKSNGAHPRTPTPEALVRRDPTTVLNHPDWTLLQDDQATTQRKAEDPDQQGGKTPDRARDDKLGSDRGQDDAPPPF